MSPGRISPHSSFQSSKPRCSGAPTRASLTMTTMFWSGAVSKGFESQIVFHMDPQTGNDANPFPSRQGEHGHILGTTSRFAYILGPVPQHGVCRLLITPRFHKCFQLLQIYLVRTKGAPQRRRPLPVDGGGMGQKSIHNTERRERSRKFIENVTD